MKKTKKMLSVLLTTMLSCSASFLYGPAMQLKYVSAETAAAEMNSVFEIDEDGLLIRYTGEGGNVVIPDGVTGIGEFAFEGCSSLTGIEIPIEYNKDKSENPHKGFSDLYYQSSRVTFNG